MKLFVLGLSLALLVCSAVCDDVKEEAVTAKYKSDLTLDCSDLGEGVEFYREGQNGSEKVVESEGAAKISEKKLTLVDIRGDVIKASYLCKQNNEVRKKFKLNVAPKLFVINKQSQTVTEGGRIELKCSLLFGLENGAEVTWKWSKNATEFAAGDETSPIQVKSNGTESSLLIRKAGADDKGEYTCSASNDFGEDAEIVQVRVKNALAALWPFLAIIAEVLILCVIILLYEKKCAKKPSQNQEDNEQAQSLTGKDNSEHLKKRGGK